MATYATVRRHVTRGLEVAGVPTDRMHFTTQKDGSKTATAVVLMDDVERDTIKYASVLVTIKPDLSVTYTLQNCKPLNKKEHIQVMLKGGVYQDTSRFRVVYPVYDSLELALAAFRFAAFDNLGK